MPNCTKCGAALADNDRFCPACGESVAPANPFAAGNNIESASTQYYGSSDDAPEIPGFGRAIQICFKKYATFKGRASRSEYWYWTLFTTIINVVLQGLMIAQPDAPAFKGIALIVGLGTLLPGLAVWVRRFHDIGKSGWLNLLFFILLFVPLVNLVAIIISLIFLVRKSDEGPNKYGPMPQKR